MEILYFYTFTFSFEKDLILIYYSILGFLRRAPIKIYSVINQLSLFLPFRNSGNMQAEMLSRIFNIFKSL